MCSSKIDELFICSSNRLSTDRKAKHLQWSGRIRPTYVAAGRYIGRTLARFKELRSKLCSTADRNSSLGWAICALKASWIASWTAPRTASCAAVRNVCESDSLARRRAGTRPYHFGSRVVTRACEACGAAREPERWIAALAILRSTRRHVSRHRRGAESTSSSRVFSPGWRAWSSCLDPCRRQ